MISTELLRVNVPPAVHYICNRLHEQGHAAWTVGGCVRDQLLASLRPDGPAPAPDDWDIATSARPDEVTRAFPRVAPTGIEHGTVTVLLDRVGYEVTTFRAEADYRDGRRPQEVRFLDDITADLARRDFTVNAIAYDPLTDTLADPFNGVADLRRGILRAVGEPIARFTEDGLRVLRAARFVATLGFDLEAITAAAITPSLSSYEKVSAERVRDEWVKAMNAGMPSRAFEVMKEHGLLAVTAPELLGLMTPVEKPSHVSAGDAWLRTMRRVDSCSKRTTLRMSALLYALGADAAQGIAKRLRFSNAEVVRVTELVRQRRIDYDQSWTNADVRRWLQRINPDLLEELCELALAEVSAHQSSSSESETACLIELRARARQLLEDGAAMSVRDLAISGKDLMSELRLAPSPQIGQLLSQLLAAVTELPELNTREKLLARARQITNERAT